MTKADEIIQDSEKRNAEIETLIEHYREDTGMSRFWAFLCGPWYFMWWGFWGRGLIVLVLSVIIPFSGIIISPIIVRKAWIDRATEKAERSYKIA